MTKTIPVLNVQHLVLFIKQVAQQRDALLALDITPVYVLKTKGKLKDSAQNSVQSNRVRQLQGAEIAAVNTCLTRIFAVKDGHSLLNRLARIIRMIKDSQMLTASEFHTLKLLEIVNNRLLLRAKDKLLAAFERQHRVAGHFADFKAEVRHTLCPLIIALEAITLKVMLQFVATRGYHLTSPDLPGAVVLTGDLGKISWFIGEMQRGLKGAPADLFRPRQGPADEQALCLSTASDGEDDSRSVSTITTASFTDYPSPSTYHGQSAMGPNSALITEVKWNRANQAKYSPTIH